MCCYVGSSTSHPACLGTSSQAIVPRGGLPGFRRAFIVLPGWALRGQHCRVEIPLTNAAWASDLPLFPFRLTRPPQISDQTARRVQGLGKVPDKHPFQASCWQPWKGQENTVLPVLSLKMVSMSEWVEFGPFGSQAVRPTKLILFAFPRAYSHRLPCVGEGALALHSRERPGWACKFKSWPRHWPAL